RSSASFVGGHTFAERDCSGERAAVEVSALKGWQDIALDYRAAGRVGKCSFEAVADLDSNFVLLGRHDKQHAVVLAFLPYPPVAAEPIAVILNAVSLKRIERDHHDLFASCALVRVAHAGEFALRRSAEHARLIDDSARERRKFRF